MNLPVKNASFRILRICVFVLVYFVWAEKFGRSDITTLVTVSNRISVFLREVL